MKTIRNMLATVLIVFSISLIIILAVNQQSVKSPAIEEPLAEPEPIEPTLTSAKTQLLFTGEVFWGRSYERNRRNAVDGALEFPFTGLSSYSHDNYDAWVGFLECPITDEDVPFEEEWNAIRLNCRPEFLPEFAKWYDILSLAGNHANDVNGVAGYELTKDYLDQYEIDYFGRLDPDIHEDICKVITVPLRQTYDDESVKTIDYPIAFCGYNGVFQTISQRSIDEISKYAGDYFTVVMPQTGAEYVAEADNLKTTTYRKMVDAGADLVIGSHPHWVQNSEVYKDKLILYSIGNFIFDQKFNIDVRSSISLDATLDFTSPDQLDYIKSLESSEEDTDTAKALPNLTYDLIPGLMTDLVQTRPTDQPTIDRILNRANWVTTQAQLNNTD